MLEGILGNKSAEKVLLHIFHYGEIHASAIADDYGIALNPIKQQLLRFEQAGILVAKDVGRARAYSFNPKSAFLKPLKEMIEIAYRAIPLEEREKIFRVRRRPRKRDKPIR